MLVDVQGWVLVCSDPPCHVTKTLCRFKGFAQKLSVPFFFFFFKKKGQTKKKKTTTQKTQTLFISELMREVLQNILRLKTHFLPLLKIGESSPLVILAGQHHLNTCHGSENNETWAISVMLENQPHLCHVQGRPQMLH